jgi:hypothetical protein
MSQHTQNSSRKNQDIRMVAKTMSEKEAQRTYRQSMQELAASLQGEMVLPDTPDYDPTNLFHLNQNITPARTGLLAA